MKIGVIILTLNAESSIYTLLSAVFEEQVASDVLVFDSNSKDRTCEIAAKFPACSIRLLGDEVFNHGATREYARKLLKVDVVVFCTQDIVPHRGWLRRLVAPILDGKCVVSYSRQIPHREAGLFESFPRKYNYPDCTVFRSVADLNKYGIFTFFCSDSSAAYLQSALDAVGGMKPILTNEDYFAAARLVMAKGVICYAADSVVEHSHQYTLIDEFRRYFDNGYVRGENNWLVDIVGHAEGHGRGFALAFIKEVLRSKPLLLPYVFVVILAKWMGYRLGYFGRLMPNWLLLKMSSQPYYWKSKYFRKAKPL